MKQKIFHLVYKSFAKPSLNEKDIQDILKTAQEKNRVLDITGLLIYRQKAFIQLLEGDEQSVRKILEKIIADSRHDQVVTILESSSDQRIASNWSMAFVNEEFNKNLAHDLFDLFDSIIGDKIKEKSLIIPILKKFTGSSYDYL